MTLIKHLRDVIAQFRQTRPDPSMRACPNSLLEDLERELSQELLNTERWASVHRDPFGEPLDIIPWNGEEDEVPDTENILNELLDAKYEAMLACDLAAQRHQYDLEDQHAERFRKLCGEAEYISTYYAVTHDFHANSTLPF